MKFLNYIFQILIIVKITLFIELYYLKIYYKLNVSKSYTILKLIKKKKMDNSYYGSYDGPKSYTDEDGN